MATYSCETGYHIEGASVTVTTSYRGCQVDGQWSGEAPACVVVTCATPEAPLNGDIEGFSDGQNYGSVVTFGCNPGSDMNGDSTRRCRADGTWSGTTPACGEVSCEAPDEMENGTVSFSDPDMGFGSQVTYACDVGYHIEGADAASRSATYTCEGSGQWSGDAPTCSRVACPEPMAPLNGTVFSRSDGNFYGSELIYACEENYDMQGEPNQTCQADGTWSGATPACGIVSCESFGELPNGMVTYTDGQAYGSTVLFTCEDDFHVSGRADTVKSVTGVCEGSGEWSVAAPTCIRVSCDPLTPPEDGSIESRTDENFAGSVVTFACDANFDMVGQPTRTCGNDGTWSGATPACGLVTCDDLGVLEDGSVTYSDALNFGSEATLTCNESHHIAGQAPTVRAVTLTCEGTGWSGDKPVCNVVDCGAPPAYANTLVDHDATTYSAEAVYQCDPDKHAVGTGGTLTCGADGEWSGTAPVCVVPTCDEALAAPEDGRIVAQEGNEVGDSVTFACDANFDLVGARTITCLSSGEWSEDPPTCAFAWAYRRQIEISGPLTGSQLLIALPELQNAAPEGADLRFSTDPNGAAFDVSHYIESWDQGLVWVHLDSSLDTLYLFYGNDDAESAAVDFGVMFPEAFTGSGDLDLGSANKYDSFELDSSGNLTVTPGDVLHIEASRLVVSGTIDGTGAGYITGVGSGFGPGRGGDPTSAEGGAGGAGYGDVGGAGGDMSSGRDTAAGEAGVSYGNNATEDIEMGSSGGDKFESSLTGGAGGGGIWLDAQLIVFDGAIDASGVAAHAASAGGGSGGGVLLTGAVVTATGDIAAEGGDGQGDTSRSTPGGGGGAGGRIKVFYGTASTVEDSGWSVTEGAGGEASGVGDVAGAPGQAGTTHRAESPYKVMATVGDEAPARPLTAM